MDKTSILIDYNGNEYQIDGEWDSIICVYFTKEDIEEYLEDTLTTIEWYQVRDFLDSQIRLRESDIWESKKLLLEIRGR